MKFDCIMIFRFSFSCIAKTKYMLTFTSGLLRSGFVMDNYDQLSTSDRLPTFVMK